MRLIIIPLNSLTHQSKVQSMILLALNCFMAPPMASQADPRVLREPCPTLVLPLHPPTWTASKTLTMNRKVLHNVAVNW